MYFPKKLVGARRRVASSVASRVSALATLLMVSVCAGCGSSAGAPGLDEEVAHSSLTTVLDAWKQGHTPESLQQSSPEIIVGEPQWTGGKRLVSYQVLESAVNDGSNLHVPVELELEDGGGVRSKQKVTYTVGTSPKITVFCEEGDGGRS